MKHIYTVLLGIMLLQPLFSILLQPLYAEEVNNLAFPEEFVYETSQVGPHEAEDITEFYPVGMSEDGEFAYLRYDGWDDGLGEKIDFTFLIQDLVTDEIVFEHSIFKEGETNTPENLWRKEPLIHEKIEEHGIFPGNLRFEKFPLRRFGSVYKAEVHWDTVSDSRFTPSTIQYVRMWKDETKKVIKGDFETYAAEIEPYGAFYTEDGRRFAVLLIDYSFSYEGPPLTAAPMIIGSHADYGYKK